MAKNKKRRGFSQKTKSIFDVVVRVCAVVALLFSIMALILTLKTSDSVPKKPQIQHEALLYSRVEYQAQNFFQVWMMGDESSKATLESFYDAVPLNDINADPAKISDLNVADLTVAPTKQGEVLWSVTLGTTMTPPGVNESTRQYYRVDLLQRGESLAVAKLPVIVDMERPTVKAQNAYPNRVNSSSPLYQVAVNFAATYLTPQSSESFGRYVTAEFVGEPLKNSPYSGAQVTSVSLEQGDSAEQASAGDELKVMIRVRASTSQSSYQTMDIPVTAIKQKNDQWLINSLSDPATVKSTEKNDSAE